ncbi:hypothetical protein QRX60_20665 [Amycolatopsis mongoliensis]|uniref:Uncharacterized protein n=1 Tax=Amycolatopsis mongoliensis TaxID=715475 RepID=A0A9Y2JWP1_9PSEU|nr:hypothetical protein [Amycolatopsis sp. 4-36]WIY06131.1 hypothetical protein QRX60_20665 [Amycolatopsis sp. 4-36]
MEEPIVVLHPGERLRWSGCYSVPVELQPDPIELIAVPEPDRSSAT